MKTPIKVLLIEDSRDDAELLLHALKRAGYQPSYALVQNAAAMKTQLANGGWDLIISDYVVPGFGGMDALKVHLEHDSDTPFIIVSGKIGEDVAVEALHAGANDYLLKDRLTRLGPAIDRALKEASHKRKRRAAEEALRESEERYRRLVESCPEAMFITCAGQLEFVNPAGVSLLGANSPVELIGKPFLDFVDPQFKDLVEEHLRQCLEGMDGPLLEERMVGLDGSSILAEAIARRIQYHGEPAVQLLCRDISSRKQLEQQLLSSQKMEAIARLAGGVANDFNNLLQVITGYSGLIRSGLAPNHPLQQDLQQIIQSSERAIGLTNQLLAISRKEVAAPEALELNLVVDQILPLLRRLMGEKIECAVDLAQELPLIQADRGQMETLMLNLAVHARESMANGGRIEFATRPLLVRKPVHNQVFLKAGEYVVLTITDTGLGLTAEYQEHLFEPFFVKEAVGHSTGLGLATVYAIVKQHKGQISCSSQVGKGSVFQIYLPVLKQLPKTPPPPAVEVSSNGSLVLVVEDEEVLRDFASLILRKHGYHVLTARDGSEAMTIAEQYHRRVDLVFTDVVMPRLSGADLWRKLMAIAPETPVIFTSGYPRSILVESGLEDSGLDFLQKPYTTQALLDKIKEVLGARRATN
jgi:PAS domain S-box-containing protein